MTAGAKAATAKAWFNLPVTVAPHNCEMPHNCLFCNEEHFPVSTLLGAKGIGIGYICNICAKHESESSSQHTASIATCPHCGKNL
jgi:hypothetical protein